MTHATVGFDIVNPGLGKSVHDCHQNRNDMQKSVSKAVSAPGVSAHGSPRGTVLPCP